MSEFLSKISPNDMVPMILFGGGMLIGLVAVIGGVWIRIHKTNVAARLKQDMLERGMSAEEIKTVMDAGRADCKP
jgi:hypothetical protein